MEEWRPIKSCPDYEASSLGRIRSFKLWRGRPGPRILRQFPNSHNYPTVRLKRWGCQRTVSTHVLVCGAFCGPRPVGSDVAHEDGNKANNRAVNLSYKSRSENHLDKRKHGRANQGTDHYNAKFTSDQVRQYRDAHRLLGVSVAELARQEGCCYARMWNAVRGSSYANV